MEHENEVDFSGQMEMRNVHICMCRSLSVRGHKD